MEGSGPRGGTASFAVMACTDLTPSWLTEVTFFLPVVLTSRYLSAAECDGAAASAAVTSLCSV